MRKRGLTLLEIMVVVVCMAIIFAATIASVSTAIRHTSFVKASRVIHDRQVQFEDKLRSILENAYLSSNATDTKSYFRGGPDVSQTSASESNDPTLLVFTGLSSRIPSELINSTDDFETLNSDYGPRGGLTEYAISMTAIGNSPVDNGLFLRRQSPADGDPSQGGYQSLLDEDIDTISYEFFDGTEWLQTWDTQESDTPRLPSAVRITYRRKDDSNDHVFVVHLIHSDVTPENPVTDGVQQ